MQLLQTKFIGRIVSQGTDVIWHHKTSFFWSFIKKPISTEDLKKKNNIVEIFKQLWFIQHFSDFQQMLLFVPKAENATNLICRIDQWSLFVHFIKRHWIKKCSLKNCKSLSSYRHFLSSDLECQASIVLSLLSND